MGRKKIHKKLFLIGLDDIQAARLERMAAGMALTYSEVISYLIDYYKPGLEKHLVRNR